MHPETRAEKLLNQRVSLEAEIAEKKKKAGITALETKLEKVKESLTEVMTEYEIEQVEGEGYHATLIRQSYGAFFLATDEDANEADVPTDRNLSSMRTIIREKFGPYKKGSKSSHIWKRITKSVVIPDAVEEVVSEGLLTVDEISPAFIEKVKKPYARVFKD